MEVKINKPVAEEAIAKFSPTAVQYYIENLAILRDACKLFADDSETKGGAQTYEQADKLVKNAESVYPDIFTSITDTISTVLEAYETSDTM